MTGPCAATNPVGCQGMNLAHVMFKKKVPFATMQGCTAISTAPIAGL